MLVTLNFLENDNGAVDTVELIEVPSEHVEDAMAYAMAFCSTPAFGCLVRYVNEDNEELLLKDF